MMKYLADILDRETEAYNEYLKLANKKKEALLSNDLDCLEAITIEEKGLTTKVLALESARVEFLKESGYDSKTSIQDLIPNLSSDVKNHIEESAKKLKDALEECKRFNENNISLLRQSSSYINHMIKVFSNAIENNPTYSRETVKLGTGKIADMEG